MNTINVLDFLVYRIKRVQISIFFFVLRILHQTTQSKFQSMTDPKKMEKVSKIFSNTEKYDIKIVSFWAEIFFWKTNYFRCFFYFESDMYVLAIMYFTVVLKIKYTHLFFAKKLIKVEILRKFLHSIFLVNKWQYTYLLYAKKIFLGKCFRKLCVILLQHNSL